MPWSTCTRLGHREVASFAGPDGYSNDYPDTPG